MEKSLTFEIGLGLSRYIDKFMYFVYTSFADVLFNKSHMKNFTYFLENTQEWAWGGHM